MFASVYKISYGPGPMPPGSWRPVGPLAGTGAFQKSGVPRRHVEMSKQTNKKNRPNEPRVSRDFFFRLRYCINYYYVNVTFSFTLRYRSVRSVSRFRLRYVTVAGVKRYRARV
jgi:hypothetical protein